MILKRPNKRRLPDSILKSQYEGEMNRLEGLLRDNHAEGEKIALLEAQLTEERSAAEAKLAQEKAFAG